MRGIGFCKEPEFCKDPCGCRPLVGTIGMCGSVTGFAPPPRPTVGCYRLEPPACAPQTVGFPQRDAGVVPVISNATGEDAWTGRTGFVHKSVLEDLPDLSGYQVYACGAPIVVDSARLDYSELAGLPEEEFYADSFVTEADKAQNI